MTAQKCDLSRKRKMQFSKHVQILQQKPYSQMNTTLDKFTGKEKIVGMLALWFYFSFLMQENPDWSIIFTMCVIN